MHLMQQHRAPMQPQTTLGGIPRTGPPPSGGAAGLPGSNPPRLDPSGNPLGPTELTRAERRAAAYEKFRQKKKSLNFGKKIRYASRKQLAEARPRVKGQFVKV